MVYQGHGEMSFGIRSRTERRINQTVMVPWVQRPSATIPEGFDEKHKTRQPLTTIHHQ